MLNNEIEKNTRRYKDFPSLWVGKNNIVKMTILSKAIYAFGIIPIKIPGPFHRHRKIILKFTWKKFTNS